MWNNVHSPVNGFVLYRYDYCLRTSHSFFIIIIIITIIWPTLFDNPIPLDNGPGNQVNSHVATSDGNNVYVTYTSSPVPNVICTHPNSKANC